MQLKKWSVERMSNFRRIAVLGVLALLALMTVSTAASASPRQIYADFADNGRLDQTYSESDLRKALADTTIQGYGKPIVKTGLRPAIQQQLGVLGQSSSGGTLPFTGVDLALLTSGAALLLLFGLAFRRFGRARA
jgi:hypothetical protein